MSEEKRLKKNACQRRYAKRHLKQEGARHLAWREENREHCNQRYRDYYAKNRASILAGQRARRHSAKERK